MEDWTAITTSARQMPVMSHGGRYSRALAIGATAGLATLCAIYLTLNLIGHLPPPPLSNNYCVDEKLAFLRENPPKHPNFLTIGSSIAWRNIDSSVLVDAGSDIRPLNGGFCGLQVHQAAFVSRWMADHWPSIEQVLLIASPLDYYNCDQRGKVFDPVDAAAFIFEEAPAWRFYLRYFDPISLARNVKRQVHDRAQARILGITRELTSHGDGPLRTDRNRGLFYGPVSRIDDRCLAALRSLAIELDDESRRFMVVTMPMHPDWLVRYDPDGSLRRRFSRSIEAALKDTGAIFWDAGGEPVLDRHAYTDAVHVRWPAARVLTEAIVRRLEIEDRSRF